MNTGGHGSVRAGGLHQQAPMQNMQTQAPVAGRLDLRRVTLVCIEGRYPSLALFSLRRCMAQAVFAEVVLFGPAAAEVPEGIRLQPIDGQIGSIEAYSEFVIRRLPDHVHSDYVLIVQWDSFILDALAWRDDFLDYDYLGAPWGHRPVAVGNGGFSLRSRSLLKAAQALPMEQTHPEDTCIAEWCRAALERDYGLRFAPREIGQRFAFERTYDDAPSFGFHGFFNFQRVLDSESLRRYLANCPSSILCSKDGRQLAKNLIRGRRLADALQILRVRLLLGNWRMRVDALQLGLRALFGRLFG